MNSLSNAQRRAVTHKDGPMLVLAGPGSGKTFTITCRVRYLIEACHVKPSEILVITFTKAAAREMRERFRKETKGRELAVSFGTFHAVFFQILKLAYGYGAENILREEQKYQFLRESVRKVHLELDDEAEFLSEAAAEISRVKNERADLRTYKASLCGSDLFRRIYEDYDNQLRRHNLIDFDDMLVYCFELLRERKDILSAWQNKFPYILVDEFQDINRLQYDIVRMLAAPRNNLFIVGDDDQSIYRFRGAKPQLMLNFRKDYPEAKQVVLDINFRSTEAIIHGAGKVIAHNKERFPKEIRGTGKKGKRIVTRIFPGQREENVFLAEKIKAYVGAGGAYRDVAVLFRTNTQPRQLVEELLSAGIPFHMRDSLPNLYDHWIVKDVFTYMRLAQGSRRREDLLQVMNRPKRYLGREYLEGEEFSWEGLSQAYADKPWVCQKLQKLRKDLKLLARLSPYGAIHYIRNIIGYQEYLEEYARNRNRKAEEFLDVLEELQALSRGFSTFAEWSEHIGRYREELKRQARERAKNSEAVHLSTMHSSKGLEYKIVFVIDANETITPHKRAYSWEDMEEERRLFYVAMTRAKEQLYLLSVKKLYNKKAEVSRFVEELLEE